VLPEDSAQFARQKIWFTASRPDDVSYRPDAHLSKAPTVRTMFHTVRTLIYLKHHLSGRRELPVRTFPFVEKFQTGPACIRLDHSQCSTKLQDFFPKHRYGKIAETVWAMWIPIRTRSSIRQVSQFKSRRSGASQHGPEMRTSDMEIACIKSTIRTNIPPVRTREAFIRKLLVVEVRPSGRQGINVRMQLKNKKEF
jgi:hypothetical protein